MDSNGFSRLVVKFQDHLNMPCHEAGEIIHYFSENDSLPFKNLLSVFPGLKIGKLFTTLEPELIVELAGRPGFEERRPRSGPPHRVRGPSVFPAIGRTPPVG